MWGLLPARCPVGTWEKTWLETRMRWLAERFGIDRMIEAEVLLPIEAHFPEPYQGTEADARRLMDRLCRPMGLDAEKLVLEVCDDVELDGAVGRYDQREGDCPAILIAKSQLTDPLQLVATLAHELSHELLLGRGLVSLEDADFEWVTDLTPVFFGLGVFAANATIAEGRRWATVAAHQEAQQYGYLPSRLFGYAFALFAFMRNESDPAWARHLRLDASSTLRQGLRYLQRGGETLFHPDTVRAERQPLTPTEARRRLREGSASARLATLWEVRDGGSKDPAFLPEIVQLLADRDADIQADAAMVAASYGAEANAAISRLIECLSSPDAAVRECAACALGEIGGEAKTVVPALSGLLSEQPEAVIRSAVLALSRFGEKAESVIRPLLVALRGMVVACNYSLADELVETLRAICSDPVRRAEKFFADDDPELLRLVLAALTSSPDTLDNPSEEPT